MTSFVRLLDEFTPPEGHSGVFGWVAGYSADSEFLNEARRRFGATHDRYALALMLDPRHPQLAPAEVPGIAHLLSRGSLPFRLQHAKVALLAFRDDEHDGAYVLRLIVSTGNWQRGSLEASLDLAWSIELDSDDESGDRTAAQRAADIAAAWDFLQWLRQTYDDALVAQSDEVAQYSRWLAESTARFPTASPRFFDNRQRSLLAQLPEMIKRQGATRRNYLAMGSGFYEAPKGSAVPGVLTKTFEVLHQSGLLTARPDVDVYVNPDSCQAVASGIAALKAQPGRWAVRPAACPPALGARPRTLHAKFIFSANSRSNSDYCNSAWLYLGSGNLTIHGFDERAEPNGGNAEAGVVFAPDRDPTWDHLAELLPVQWKCQYEQPAELKPGTDEYPDRFDLVLAPPLPWLDWHAATPGEPGGWLRPPPEFPLHASLEVLDGTGRPCQQESAQGYAWLGSQPRQVRVRWRQDDIAHTADVPVRHNGLFAAPLLSTGLNAEDMLDALLADGSILEDLETDDFEDGTDETPQGILPVDEGRHAGAQQPASRTFVRDAMVFMERIAEAQTASSMNQVRWKDWCARLASVLGHRGADGPLAQAIRDSGLNLLAPLKHPAFRPSFAEDDTTEAGRYYETVLDDIERRWELAGLPRLGETQ